MNSKKDKIISGCLLALTGIASILWIKISIDNAYIEGQIDQLEKDTEMLNDMLSTVTE